MDIKTLSHEKLVQLAYEYGILIDYRMSPSTFQLFLFDGTVVECDPAEARFFLRGMLRGYQYALQMPQLSPGLLQDEDDAGLDRQFEV